MAEETTDQAPEVEPVDEAPKADESSDDNSLKNATKEDLLKYIEKLNRENASKRVKAKEQEEKAKRWEEHVQSQKTELERLTESKTAAETELAELKANAARDKIGRDSQLDPEFWDLLTGTEEEMKAKATKLVSKFGKAPGGGDFYSGNRGSKVPGAAKPTTSQEWFEQMWENASTTKKF